MDWPEITIFQMSVVWTWEHFSKPFRGWIHAYFQASMHNWEVPKFKCSLRLVK